MRLFLLLAALLSALPTFAQGFTTVPFSEEPIQAKVSGYHVKADLSNVANRKVLPKLTAEQKKALVANAFLARPTAEEQLFYIYENNAYKDISSFVTTDSVLHTYHVFYDFTLRYLEKERLFAAVKELCQLMLAKNIAALPTAQSADIRTALTRNVVFFAVPLTLLGEKPVLPSQQIQQQVDTEIKRIMAHNGRDYAVTGVRIDYTQFIPRGHYTRSPAFQQYFRAMMWLGLVPMDLEKGSTLQALIITEQLQGDSHARDLWQRLYDPTAFYVGRADDLSYYDYAKLSTRVFGNGTFERFADAAKLETFLKLVDKELPHPGIEANGGGQQFRFMGQRFIPDSRIFQEMSYPKVSRQFPLGLDIFAVMGSPRATQLLDKVYKQPQYAHYLSARAKMQQEIRKLTPAQWQQNLYYGWMYCLHPLLSPHARGYPSFMRSTAWQDKSLVTALGSWTELRHDTILYAKQSSAECGEGGDEPPPVPGYVEPEVGVYERLSWLLKLNMLGLQQRKLLDEQDELTESFIEFSGLVDFLAVASRKELRNESLTRDELDTIEHYGGELERLMLSVASLGAAGSPTGWWDIENKTDRNMALIADVHTYMGTVLEEGVGSPAEIWVVVPIKGKLWLTRGATFSYYEFKQPAANRLTDEAWQQQLKKGAQPALPIWMRSFFIGPGPHTPAPTYQMDAGQTGC